MLKIEGLSKSFGSLQVVDSVSLVVGPEIQVVVGLNGSGKSTMLKLVAGILSPEKGSAWINGREITSLPPEERHIGYVPQQAALFRHMSVGDNIRYCLRNGRGSEQTALQSIEMLGLEEVLHKKAVTLSGGFQSRVSLARTLASQPQAMLLDEPLSDLDVAIKESLIPQFRKALKSLGVPVVYVTHDVMEAKLMGDCFSAMIRGRLSEVGSAEEAFETIRCKVF